MDKNIKNLVSMLEKKDFKNKLIKQINKNDKRWNSYITIIT